MSEEKLSSEYIRQGFHYLLFSESAIITARVILRENILPVLMQEALDEIMAEADYFRVRLVRQGDDFFLTENREPCILYAGNEEREIPGETNGYLFYIRCEDCTLTVTLHHFLCDGYGVRRFLTELLAAYCRRRYGVAVRSRPLRSDPMFDWETLLKTRTKTPKQPELYVNPAGLPFSDMRNTILSVDRRTATACAADKWQTMPFSFFLATFCEAMTQQEGMEKMVYAYPFDYRRAVGCPDALYNAATLRRNVFRRQDSREDMIRVTDAYVDQSFLQAGSEKNMAENMAIAAMAFDIAQTKAPWSVKQRVCDMYYASTVSHVLFSYMGNTLFPGQKALGNYIDNMQAWMQCEKLKHIFLAPIIVEETTLREKMNFCISYPAAYRGVLDRWKAILAEEGVPVEEHPQ